MNLSYCVNCGVELDGSATKCVLCSAPVINPLKPGEKEAPPPYPQDKFVVPAGVRKQYAAFIVSMVILIPTGVCTLINFLVPASGRWALYVIGTSALVWFLFVLPSFFEKPHPYTFLSIDAVILSFYIFVIFAGRTLGGWFLQLALPLIMFFFAICMFMIKWLSRKRDGIVIAIAVLAEISLFSLFADFFISRFYEKSPLFFVSIIITASCAALIVFFIFAVTNKRFRAWLSRKFFTS